MQQLIYYCEEKQGAQRDYPFGPEPLVMKVAGKMFALISSDSISLKCNPEIAQNLREQHTVVKPGYHLNKMHWNTVTVDGTLSELELQAMIDHSYELVVASLTKLARAELTQA
ncbi:MmcQ/YjbR family DNA-binding protein [Paenibacillus prosopidis]|uniref:Putative DNA-binding protein (MmcQ/YjbR family) n=1 Tax=Paenibacillus prosopidis TaxID=630520 RepID=A0A368VN75_9BACL|nr:MmcQ/YjbR family DNA-binding protein [Paenibacillus prosopidis]RCW42970.1 putative DNA-binding protein (MmcQ/YjbR family) [Paenibacillus prosopidis]